VRLRLCTLVRPVGSQLGRQTNRGNLLIRSRRRAVRVSPDGSARWEDYLRQSLDVRARPWDWAPEWVP
jgi:hypothetical protein